MFNREWGLAAKVPFVQRGFDTLDPNGVTIDHFSARSIGDVELMGMYTGFSKDVDRADVWAEAAYGCSARL